MKNVEITRPRPRIAIIVNKRREVEGFLAGLKGSGFLSDLETKDQNTPPAPCYRMSEWRMNVGLEQMDFTVRCIEDIMPPENSRVPETRGSHSRQKAMLLPGYLRDNDADLLISVSAAESTPSIQANGTSMIEGQICPL